MSARCSLLAVVLALTMVAARLGIAAYGWWNEGLHGVSRLQTAPSGNVRGQLRPPGAQRRLRRRDARPAVELGARGPGDPQPQLEPRLARHHARGRRPR